MSVMSNNSPSTAPTSAFYDDSHTVTLRVQCGDVQKQIEALNGRLDELINGIASLKGDNMVAVSALSSNMMYLEKQTELMVAFREQQEAERENFEERLAQMVQKAVEEQFEKQQARLDRIFHDKLNSFGTALLREQKDFLSVEGKTLYSEPQNETTPSATLMLSQIMHSIQTVASETQILRGELTMEMKMYQQQLLELVQNNLVYFLQHLEGMNTGEPETTCQSRFSDVSTGTFRHYPSEQDRSFHSLASSGSHRFDDAVSSPTTSNMMAALMRNSTVSTRPRDSTLFSNPRSAPSVPKEDKTASDISMKDANVSGVSEVNANMSMNDFLASTTSLNTCNALTPYETHEEPSEISQMEIFVRNITTRKSESGSLRTIDEDRKFLTKVSRLFKPKK
ncbi:hypothetical protein CJU89_3553 [Yarrowia sp. B02]|nr:hypothetical protein CJU89_3553 [Yarrowia sp. B02]